MLSKKSLALAKHIVVSNESRVLFTRERTNVFTDVIRLSYPIVSPKSLPSVESVVELVSTAAGVETEGGHSQHEEALTNTTEMLVAGLLNQMSFTRKTVLPFVDTVSNALLGKISDTTPVEFIVKQFEFSDLAQDGTIRSELSKFKVPQEISRLIKNAPEKDAEVLITAMKTGINEVDEKLGKVIAEMGPSVVVDLYNCLFRNIRPTTATTYDSVIRDMLSKNPNNGHYIITLPDYFYIDLAIVGYLLVESLVSNPLEGTGISLVEYENALLQLRNQFGAVVNRMIANYDKDVTNDRLMIRRARSTGIHFDDVSGTILVNGEVYRKAMQQGITPETVIGAQLHNPVLMGLRDIVQKKSTLDLLWKKNVADRDSYTLRTTVSRFKANMTSAFDTAVKALNDDVFPGDYDRTAAVSGLRNADKEVDHFFHQWDTTQVVNIYQLVLDLSCKYIFNYVDAKTIIDIIEDECQASNEYGEPLTARQAAYYAAVKYLAKWMVANFDINRNQA